MTWPHKERLAAPRSPADRLARSGGCLCSAGTDEPASALPSLHRSELVIAASVSVAPEPLLLPGVAVVVVAETFPEAWLALVQQLDPAGPRGALPQLQVGTSSCAGPPCFAGGRRVVWSRPRGRSRWVGCQVGERAVDQDHRGLGLASAGRGGAAARGGDQYRGDRDGQAGDQGAGAPPQGTNDRYGTDS